MTGGARDIGRWISIELAKYGCHIAVADIDIDGAKDCCEELHMLGVKAFPYKVSVHCRWYYFKFLLLLASCGAFMYCSVMSPISMKYVR